MRRPISVSAFVSGGGRRPRRAESGRAGSRAAAAVRRSAPPPWRRCTACPSPCSSAPTSSWSGRAGCTCPRPWRFTRSWWYPTSSSPEVRPGPVWRGGDSGRETPPVRYGVARPLWSALLAPAPGGRATAAAGPLSGSRSVVKHEPGATPSVPAALGWFSLFAAASQRWCLLLSPQGLSTTWLWNLPAWGRWQTNTGTRGRWPSWRTGRRVGAGLCPRQRGAASAWAQVNKTVSQSCVSTLFWALCARQDLFCISPWLAKIWKKKKSQKKQHLNQWK